jgi:pentatricopeptide repeat protein
VHCLQGLEPDTICYNTMISCLERSNQPDRALEVFEQMQVCMHACSGGIY